MTTASWSNTDRSRKNGSAANTVGTRSLTSMKSFSRSSAGQPDRYMKTSVALCTYNGERYLLEQLESIAGQTVPVDEIVICDDHSTDRTPDIIRNFAATSTLPVRAYFNEKNLGSDKNFEKAIELC